MTMTSNSRATTLRHGVEKNQGDAMAQSKSGFTQLSVNLITNMKQ